VVTVDSSGSASRGQEPTALRCSDICAPPASRSWRSTGPTARHGEPRASPTRWTPTPLPAPRWPAALPVHPRLETAGSRRSGLRVARNSAVKARSQTTNQLKALLVSAPAQLREQLRCLTANALITACARLRPAGEVADPEHATKTALRRLARRHQFLSEEISDADTQLRTLVTAVAPSLIALPGVGTQVAGQILTTVGDNPDRLHSQALFAHLCGVAPIPASSGRTRRHRLNRGGDRAANNVLYVVVLGRLRYDPRTKAYAARRTTEGLSKPEIIRCLKRYIAREIYNALQAINPPKHSADAA